MRIAGLDEVGRGALAGPLVAAGVILKSSRFKNQGSITRLDDSKKLKHEHRAKLYKEIIGSGAEVVTEVISVRQVNNRGMGWANKEIFRRIIRKMEADKYIVDGNLRLGRINGKSAKVKSVVKADASRKCVMAAAIVAKEFRDEIMNQLHGEFPKYGWRSNKGYGTKGHIQAIRDYGAVKYHRDVYVNTVLSGDLSVNKLA